MNKQKLISVLQSRIAKRRKQITFFSEHEKNYTARLALEQKEDKATLRQLIMDEREIKDWKREFERSLETNRSLEVQIRHVKATGHPLVRGMAN